MKVSIYPVLEARLCGTTTIASDISEIREAGGDDTVYIKPDAQNIAAAMEKVWNEPPKANFNGLSHLGGKWRTNFACAN